MRPLVIAFPIFNEGVLAREFVEALDRCAGQLTDYEISVLVANDGSTDDTLTQLEAASKSHFSKFNVITLTRNFGHSYAVQCLIDHTPGPLTLLMDADFQDDPEDIPGLLNLYERSGADIVRVARGNETGFGLHRFLFSGFRLVYRLLTRETQAFGTFGLYSSRAIDHLRRFRDEAHRYFPGLVSHVGLKTAVLPLSRAPRRRGESKVGLRRLFRLAFDAFFSYSVLPIRLASAMGLLVTFSAVIAIAIIVYIRLWTTYAIPGWSSTLAVSMFFGGVQLLFLGVLGEYVARIFEQVKNRPHYFIESTRTLPVTSTNALSPR